MMGKEDIKIIYEGRVGEIIEKKSRFIATVRGVETEEAALLFIEEMKKKYWDATHNCSAFVIGAKGEITRCSDDGEPSQTAGRPILDIIVGEGLTDTAVVVTRYFGGTLLGTGGLVRAYSKAAKEGILASSTAWKRYGSRLHIRVAYTELGKVQFILEQNHQKPEKIEYEQDVQIVILLPVEIGETITKELIKVTNAKAKITELERLFYIDKSL